MTSILTCLRIFLFMIVVTMLIVGISIYRDYDDSVCDDNNRYNLTVYDYSLKTYKCHHNYNLCYIGIVYFSYNNQTFCTVVEQLNNMNQSEAVNVLHERFPLNSTIIMYVYENECFLTQINTNCSQQKTGLIILCTSLGLLMCWVISESSFCYYKYNKKKNYVPILSSESDNPDNINF